MQLTIKYGVLLPLVALLIWSQSGVSSVWANSPLTLEEQGFTHMEQGHWNEALALFEQALQIDPQNAQIYTNMGFVYLSREDWLAAKRALSRAIELNPSLTEAWYNLASALFGLGQGKEALVAIKRALDLNPTDPQLQKAAAFIEQSVTQQPLPSWTQTPPLALAEAHRESRWLPLGISLAIPGGGQIYKGVRHGEPWEWVRGGLYASGAALCYWQVMQNSQSQQQSGALFWSAGLAFITLFSALDGAFSHKSVYPNIMP